jgi:hypothetical protein
VGRDTGHLHLPQQEAVEPFDDTKGDGGASSKGDTGNSSVLAAFFLAITLLIGTWTLLPKGKVNIGPENPASEFVNTRENDCSSTSGGFKSSWNCQRESTTTTRTTTTTP